MTNEEKKRINPFAPYREPEDPLDRYPYGPCGPWGPTTAPSFPDPKTIEAIKLIAEYGHIPAHIALELLPHVPHVIKLLGLGGLIIELLFISDTPEPGYEPSGPSEEKKEPSKKKSGGGSARGYMGGGPGGATANAVVHVAGGKYTFNVDKLDGAKLKQILLQVASEVRPNG